jgi:hypothetical protein
MMASVIYHMMALDVDPWFIKAVDRLRCGFLWADKPDPRGYVLGLDLSAHVLRRARFPRSQETECRAAGQVALVPEDRHNRRLPQSLKPRSIIQPSIMCMRTVQQGLQGAV